MPPQWLILLIYLFALASEAKTCTAPDGQYLSSSITFYYVYIKRKHIFSHSSVILSESISILMISRRVLGLHKGLPFTRVGLWKLFIESAESWCLFSIKFDCPHTSDDCISFPPPLTRLSQSATPLTLAWRKCVEKTTVPVDICQIEPREGIKINLNFSRLHFYNPTSICTYVVNACRWMHRIYCYITALQGGRSELPYRRVWCINADTIWLKQSWIFCTFKTIRT